MYTNTNSGEIVMVNNRLLTHKSTLILAVDMFAFTAFLFLTSSGLLLHYMLTPGSGRWSLVWGISRHEWGDIHFWIALTFFWILTLHVLLHWKVIAELFSPLTSAMNRFRICLGIVGLSVLVAIAIAPLLNSIETQIDRDTRH